MTLLTSHKVPRERETADPPEVGSDPVQVTRDLREDTKRKRVSFAATVSNESSTAGLSPDFLTDSERVGLAVRKSVASTPGAYRGEKQRRLPKPFHEKLLEAARRGVMDDSDKPQPDMGPQLSSAELRAIDDLQVSMIDLQLCTAMEDVAEKHVQRQRRSRKLWAAIAACVLTIIGAVVGVPLGLLGGKGRNDEEPESLPTASAFDVNSCYSRSDEASERYDSFRSVVVSLFPDMATAIDTSYSIASVALCWVSDFDEFELEISEGNEFELIQRFVLTAVYYQFEGTAETVIVNQFSRRNWLSGLHVCEWGFVECYNTGEDQNEVTGLSVGSIGLTGRIPTELAMLKNLLHLGFVQNLLTGSIPSELGLLSQLDNLDLHNNQLTGSVPSELGLLNRTLTVLFLEVNRLAGSLPSELGLLTQLSQLHLSRNRLTGSLPSELALMTHLSQLHLNRNQLTGSLPSELAFLTQLNHLQLPNNQLTGSIPSELGLLNRTLMLLGLEINFITGSIPSQLGLLTHLSALVLVDNLLTGSLPSELGCLNRTLKWLHLANNRLTGSLPSQLGLLTQVKGLNVARNQLTGSMPASLCSSVGTKFYIDCGEIACMCCTSFNDNKCD